MLGDEAADKWETMRTMLQMLGRRSSRLVGDNAGNASDVRETTQQISERQCGQCFRCEGDEAADK